MGLCNILTVIFVVLKLVDVVDWSWWACFLPTMIWVAMIFLVHICTDHD